MVSIIDINAAWLNAQIRRDLAKSSEIAPRQYNQLRQSVFTHQ